MKTEIIECAEFDQIDIDISQLLEGGELCLDSRIKDRGYISVSIREGKVTLRADKHVGLIPINNNFAIRVVPRASISNLSHMVVRSGVVPAVIEDFSRGYLPSFEVGEGIERAYYSSLVSSAELVLAGGLKKSYVAAADPPAWRGRLLISDTVRKYRAKGIAFRTEFAFETLTYACVENIAIKEALVLVKESVANDKKPTINRIRIDKLLRQLEMVPPYQGQSADLVRDIAKAAVAIPRHLAHYIEPLWLSYLILQSKLPDLINTGFVTLDSLIINVSNVFEAYIRKIIQLSAAKSGWTVRDGNLNPHPLFSDTEKFSVKPDIVIYDDDQPIAIVDVKYKLDPKESDRYELLAFMESLGVTKGAFICPQSANCGSRYIGRTMGNKSMSIIRYDLSAIEISEEDRVLEDNLRKLVEGNYSFH